jgi:predicted ester cyclase
LAIRLTDHLLFSPKEIRMSTQDNKATNRRFYEVVLNQQNLAALEDFVAPNYTGHSFPPNLPPGPAGLKIFLTLFFTGFPDGKVTIEDMLAEGDRTAARLVFSGTHQGDFMGILPTGKVIAVPSIDLARFVDGKIVDHWGGPDQMSLMIQLGVVSMPG